MLGFDFSENIFSVRKKHFPENTQVSFVITEENGALIFTLGGLRHVLAYEKLSVISKAVCLKMLLNTHSTALMGRLNRYEDNIMTWVRPSNYKLIDRSIRYCEQLLLRKGIHVPYEDICLVLFSIKDAVSHSYSVGRRQPFHFAKAIAS